MSLGFQMAWIKRAGSVYSQVFWLLLISIFVLGIPTKPLWARSRVEELVDLMSLEQLMSLEVNSTSFFDTPIEKTPGSLYIISRDTLDFSYGKSLADYLSYYVPGAHISEFYDKGALYSTRGISGGSNTTALFMLDSESLNTSSGMSSNLNLPLLGYADRVEVLNGPCSLLHGSGSVNGFVNIIHKNGTDNPGSFVSMESGLTDGQILMETGHGLSGPNYGDVYIYAGVVKSNALDNPAKSADAFTEPSFRTSLNWRKDKFSLTAFAQNEEFESGLTDHLTDTDEGYPTMEMDSYVIMPRFQSDFTDTEDMTISLPLKYFKKSQVFSGPDQEYSDASEFQLKANILFRSTRVDDHRIAGGGSATFYKMEQDSRQYGGFPDSEDSGDGPSLTDISLDLSWVDLSLFMEDTVQLTRNLSLISGIRFDSVHAVNFKRGIDGEAQTKVDLKGDYDEVLTPRIGLTYELAQAKILKFMYQEGYNYPNYAGRIAGNATRDISTEKVQSFELGYHQSLGDLQGEFNLNAYYNMFRDTALQGMDEDEGNHVPKTIVVDRFAAVGFEASVVFHPFKNTRLDASYAFSRPFDIDTDDLTGSLTDSNGDEWIIYPAHTVKLNLTKNFFNDRLDITLGCLYNNSISTMGENTPASVNEDVFDHHRFVVNAAARYQVAKDLFFTLGVKNILDNEVPATGYYYYWGYETDNNSFSRPGVYAGLDWKF